jgi:hypothetical protein
MGYQILLSDKLLARLGFEITYREATLPIIAGYLQADQPVIAFVDTAELPYWSVATNHALVIIGLDADNVIANDPAIDNVPVSLHSPG